jgi:hypothetical protein
VAVVSLKEFSNFFPFSVHVSRRREEDVIFSDKLGLHGWDLRDEDRIKAQHY